MKLEECCLKIGSGATPRGGKESYLDEGPFTLIRSQNIHNNLFVRAGLAFISDEQAKQLQNVDVKKEDVLLNITGDSVARVCQVPDDVLPARVNQHVAIIRPDPNKLFHQFLHYLLVSSKMQAHMLMLASAGATRNALTKGMIDAFEIPEISLSEQKAIASVLGALDDKIENNRRMNETLEAMAQALFKDWFVDFSPVHAKAAGKKPAHMDAKTAALFPSTFGDDGLPEGWKLWSLGEMTEKITKGTTPSKKDLMKVGQELSVVNFLKVNNISNICYFNKKPFEKIPTSIHENQLKRSILEVDHILYSIAGTIGRVIIIDGEILPANTNQALAILKPQKAVCPTGYLRLILSNSNFQAKLNSNVVQGVQANLGLSIISAQMFVFPPAEIINQIFSTMDNLLRLQKNNFKESQTLAEMRDLLLPRLMSGQLRVATTGQKNGDNL